MNENAKTGAQLMEHFIEWRISPIPPVYFFLLSLLFLKKWLETKWLTELFNSVSHNDEIQLKLT